MTVGVEMEDESGVGNVVTYPEFDPSKCRKCQISFRYVDTRIGALQMLVAACFFFFLLLLLSFFISINAFL